MLTIGRLGQSAGVKVPTIRYYEEIGLLPEAERSAGNQRLYTRRTLERLTFIRHARELGFRWTPSATCSACRTGPTSPAPARTPSHRRSLWPSRRGFPG